MPHSSLTTTITLLLLLLFISSSTTSSNLDLTTRRNLALMDQDHDPPLKKLKPTLKPKNQTKLITPNSTTTTTKKPNKLSKTLNATKPIKPKKLNSTTTTTTTPLLKTKLNKTLISKPLTSTSKPSTKPLQQQNNVHQTPTWLDDGSSSTDDLIADFRDIPSHLLPDLERLSTTSKAYISLANLKLTKTVKPYVGTKHAANVATAASAAFLFLPLLLLAVAFRKLKTFLSLHGLLLFIQAYLAIYFATLAASALATGLEPLLYLHAASPPAYALVQALQTLGYVMYLVVQVVHLVVVFNDEGGGRGGAARGLGLAQMVVGLAVGVHYYAAVFHRAVAGEPPRAGWRVHAAYAACFVVICACGRAEQRKKAYYVTEGGDDGKKS